MSVKMDRVLLLLSTVLVATLLTQSPRFFVDGRSVRARDVATTTANDLVELTTQLVSEATTSLPITTVETLKTSANVKTTPESITEATTVINERADPNLMDFNRYIF